MNPFAHRRMHRLLAAYLDGELHGAPAGAVREHVRGCWWCSGEAETHRLVRVALRASRERTTSLPVLRLRRFLSGVDQPLPGSRCS